MIGDEWEPDVVLNRYWHGGNRKLLFFTLAVIGGDPGCDEYHLVINQDMVARLAAQLFLTPKLVIGIVDELRTEGWIKRVRCSNCGHHAYKLTIPGNAPYLYKDER